MRNRAHAVVVVAEGAGQHLVNDGVDQRDASGNLLHDDIGYFLQAKIKNYFAARRFPISLKYIDPSYYIRSVPANVFDRYLSDLMARHAVHAAMAGKTGLMIGYQHAAYFHVPIPVVVRQSKVVDMESDLGRAVLAATGQPRW
jgi:6-phosphofructokinase 1